MKIISKISLLTNATELRYHENMKIEELIQRIRTAGLRMTEPRRRLLSVFLDSQMPLSAKNLLGRLADFGIEVNKTTVYREIESLIKIGVLKSIQLGERSTYYELASTEHHHHLVCLGCNRVEDVDMNESSIAKQEQKIASERRFQISYHALEFFGLCQQCQDISC